MLVTPFSITTEVISLLCFFHGGVCAPKPPIRPVPLIVSLPASSSDHVTLSPQVPLASSAALTVTAAPPNRSATGLIGTFPDTNSSAIAAASAFLQNLSFIHFPPLRTKAHPTGQTYPIEYACIVVFSCEKGAVMPLACLLACLLEV